MLKSRSASKLFEVAPKTGAQLSIETNVLSVCAADGRPQMEGCSATLRILTSNRRPKGNKRKQRQTGF